MTGKRILVVDDEPDIHKIAQLGLSMTTSWEVLTATSGADGFEIALKEQPDAILLDAMMPVQDGIATIQQLKAEPKTQDIPVIFFTAKAQAANRREFYQLGASGVVTKPFDPTTLGSQIAGFLGWQL
ncbi:MAG: response regulator [Cyanobacteria bacterium J06626_23]